MKIVVTGGTKGIGWAIVNAFAQAGHDIAFCSRNKKELKHKEATLKAIYQIPDIISFQADLTKKGDMIAFFDFVQRNWGAVDVLINNAGVFIPGDILKEEEGNLELQMETNVYSAYYMTRYFFPLIKNSKKGHIFNICSIASITAYKGGGSYTISKFAMLGFSKVLREETKTLGIGVTSVMPGATWSASWGDEAPYPRERLMEPRDVAKTVLDAYNMGKTAVIEEIIIRPQLGDL